jgi:hypothetical protein
MNFLNIRSTNLPQLTLAIGDHSLEQLRCSCGAWAALSLESTEVIRNGVTICGPMPTLLYEPDPDLPAFQRNLGDWKDGRILVSYR